jgi:hypothetical protein
MNISIASPPNARARDVQVGADFFTVHLQDGRSVIVPLEWFPRLRDATPEQREHWELLGLGSGIHWPELDEDISVAGLLGLPD